VSNQLNVPEASLLEQLLDLCLRVKSVRRISKTSWNRGRFRPKRENQATLATKALAKLPKNFRRVPPEVQGMDRENAVDAAWLEPEVHAVDLPNRRCAPRDGFSVPEWKASGLPFEVTQPPREEPS
jgi:hypothetical protein